MKPHGDRLRNLPTCLSGLGQFYLQNKHGIYQGGIRTDWLHVNLPVRGKPMSVGPPLSLLRSGEERFCFSHFNS